MRRSTVKLVAATSILYYAIFLIVRTLLPSSIPLPLYFLAAPLLIVVLVLSSDLSARATRPTEPQVRASRERRLARRVQQITQQIEVGTNSSRSYYDGVVLARMREILTEKVSLETGLERKEVQDILANKILGPDLLKNMELYRLLYSGAPSAGLGRVRLLEQAVTMVEAWKP